MKLQAEVIPFSSVVGGGIALLDPDGRQVAQLGLMGLGNATSTNTFEEREEFKVRYQAMCKHIADAINAGQAETRAKHLKSNGVYDVLGEALGQGGIFEDQKAIVYRRPGGGRLFFRLPGEFFDGRFEELPQA